MLPKKYRLVSKKDFARIAKKGKRSYGKLLTLVYMPSAEPNTYRYGLVISKKVSKRAVVRNKIKRQISSYLAGRMHQNKLHAINAMILVKSVPDSYNALIADLEYVLSSVLDD